MAVNKAKLERDILNDVCQYLKDKDFFFWRSNNIPVFGKNNAGKMTFRSMPKFSKKGVPDIIVVYKGKFIGIEVKRPNQGLRPAQITFRDQLASNGGFYFVVSDVSQMADILQ